jgi:hypothetical protein
MAVAAPEWLTRHGGGLRLGPDGLSWFVLLDGEPQYQLVPRPAVGKYWCEVTQTINGRLIESPGTYASADEAVAGGLEALRKALGW